MTITTTADGSLQLELNADRDVLREAAEKEELFKKTEAWYGHVQGVYGTLPDRLWISQELVDALEAANIPENSYWPAVLGYRPTVGGLTVQDYLQWYARKLKEHNERYSRHQSSYYRSSHYNFDLGYKTYEQSYSWGEQSWTVQLISQRTDLPTRQSYSSTYREGESDLNNILRNEFSYRKGKVDPYARQAVSLYEFILQDEFTGTFQEWLDEESHWTPEALEARDRYVFRREPLQVKFLSYAGEKTVAYFGNGAQKRTVKLLFEQDHATWRLIVERAEAYKKGKTHAHLEVFLKEISNELNGVKEEAIEVLSAGEIRRKMTRLICEGALRENDVYNADRLHSLVKIALTAVPSNHNLTTYAKEYSVILHHFDERISTLMGQEEEDKTENNPMGIRLTVGFILALYSPRTWMRGSIENAYFLMADLFKNSEGLGIIKLLAALALEDHPSAPTETEWRKAMALEKSYDTPPEWFLPMWCSSTSMEKGARRGVGDEVYEARRWFRAPGK